MIVFIKLIILQILRSIFEISKHVLGQIVLGLSEMYSRVEEPRGDDEQIFSALMAGVARRTNAVLSGNGAAVLTHKGHERCLHEASYSGAYANAVLSFKGLPSSMIIT